MLAVNGKKPNSLREINEAILFAPKGSVLSFSLRRGDEKINVDVPVSGGVDFSFDTIEQKRKLPYSAKTNLIEDGIKEQSAQSKLLNDFGLGLDAKLVVVKVAPNSSAAIFGVEAGDRVLEVDGVGVASRVELESEMGDNPAPVLLLRRGEFDYFLKVQR